MPATGFIQVILSHSIQLKLLTEEPGTLVEAVTLACRLQAVEEAQKQFKTVKNASAVHVPDRDNLEKPGNSRAVASFSSINCHHVEQLTKTVAELTVRSMEHRKPPQGRQRKCWSCRQAGHLQCDCPRRKPDVQQKKNAMGYTSAVAC